MNVIDTTKPGPIFQRGSLGYRWRLFGLALNFAILPLPSTSIATPHLGLSTFTTIDGVRVVVLAFEQSLWRRALRVDLLLMFGEPDSKLHAAAMMLFSEIMPVDQTSYTQTGNLLDGDDDGAQ